jgi:hypothetical protein
MKTPALLPLLAGNLLLTATAHAQTTFSVGPRVGLNVATVHFPDKSSSRLAGFEAGLTGNFQLGHLAVQPSLLFSQKGYRTHGNLFTIDTPGTYEETVRLNYFTLPVNLAYTLGKQGQGVHLFAGPYVGLLLGGTYTRRVHEDGYLGGPAYDAEYGGKVKAADVYTSGGDRYAQRLDAGLQAGVGYRLKGWQVQAGYSLGLRNLASSYQASDGTRYREATNYNRAFQLSLSYLLGAKS